MKKWKRLAARPLAAILSLLLICPSALSMALAEDEAGDVLYYNLRRYGATITATNPYTSNAPLSNMLDGDYSTGCSIEVNGTDTSDTSYSDNTIRTLISDFYITIEWEKELSMNAVTITGNYPKRQGVRNFDIEVRESADGEWRTLQSGVTPDWKTDEEKSESFTVDLGAPVSATGLRLKINTVNYTWRHFVVWEIQIPMTDDAIGAYNDNLAAKDTATASSSIGEEVAKNAFDGNLYTTWTANAVTASITIGLGGFYDIDRVVLKWGDTNTKAYAIQISPDQTHWKTVYIQNSRDQNNTPDTIGLDTMLPAQYVRLTCLKYWSSSCYNLAEFEVYGIPASSDNVNDIYRENLALHCETSESDHSESNLPTYANDGNLATRWAAKEGDVKDIGWITVDLGACYDLDSVVLIWENTHYTQYKIQVSPDNTAWTDAYEQSSGKGNIETIKLTDVAARYVRMQGIKSSSSAQWGGSLWEFEVYGTKVEPSIKLPNVARKATKIEATSSLEVNLDQGVGGPAALIDGEYKVGWASAEEPVYPLDITLSFGTPQAFDSLKLVCNYAKSQAPTEISILVSADGETWKPVVENQKLVWLTDEGPTGDYNDEKTISFPYTVKNARGLQLRITEANTVWSKVCIEEIELYSTDTLRVPQGEASAVDVEVGKGFTGITNGGSTLTAGIDYVINDRIVTLQKSYLNTLSVGQYTLNFDFGANGKKTLTLFVDTSASITITFIGKYQVPFATETFRSSTELTERLESIKVPTVYGYVFDKWDFTDDGSAAEWFNHPDSPQTVTALYKKDDKSQYTLKKDSAHHGNEITVASSGQQLTEYSNLVFDQGITVSVDSSKDVAYWLLDNTKVGFKQTSYTFYVSGNNKVGVVYEDDKADEATNDVVLQQASVVENGDNNFAFTIIAQTSLPKAKDGDTIKYGVIFSRTSADLKALLTDKTNENGLTTLEADKYIKVESSAHAPNKQYMISLLGIGNHRERFAIAYAVVNEKVIYSQSYASVTTGTNEKPAINSFANQTESEGE